MLENLAPDARSAEFLYEHDAGMAQVRRRLEREARRQIEAETPAQAAE